jgi:L-fucose mutarotase/ribose pyranase (RbsD/FucU family)
MSCFNKLNPKQYKTIEAIDKPKPERKILAANKKEIKKQPEDAKEKIETDKKQMEEIESKLTDVLPLNNTVNKSIAVLQTKVESERKENDKLKKNLNKTINKTKSLEKVNKIKGDVFVQAKSNKTFYKIKLNSDLDNTDSDIKNQEVIFKVQIVSSSTRLTTNSLKLKGLKNVWEYKDNGIYKYTIGNKKDLESASKLQSEFRRKGFTDAFVVSFKNEKRIPVREALKLLN